MASEKDEPVDDNAFSKEEKTEPSGFKSYLVSLHGSREALHSAHHSY